MAEVYGGGVWWKCMEEVYGGGVWWRCMVVVYGGSVWWFFALSRATWVFTLHNGGYTSGGRSQEFLKGPYYTLMA